MKISYNWLKWYVPEIPNTEKLRDIFTYHLCEVEGVEKKGDDVIFDINIFPNRAHDLLSHRGVAQELASLLNIKFFDPTPTYKIPESKSTDFKVEIKSEKCRRYMGRVVRNIKIGSSPEWVVKHLESIGQRSINNMVDVTNIVMYDCGQPTHVFDLDKLHKMIIVREVKDEEEMTTLDNKELKLKSSNMVITDEKNILAIAGVKGGKIAEVDDNTKNIILEVANFDPVSVRKTAQVLNILTDSRKRFENDLSPELALYAMLELSALVLEMCPEAVFEEVVDVYPKKQEEKKLSFSAARVASILGVKVSMDEIKNILERYNFTYTEKDGAFEITIPSMRLDLVNEEDIAEEIGRVLGYDKIKPKITKINFKPKQNETYGKIVWARKKLLFEGYGEVMNSSFCNHGEVAVLASASDKNFLRTNLTDGLKESLKLNQVNALLLGLNEVKIFEIGTVFKNSGEEMRMAYGDKKGIKETTLDKFFHENSSLKEHGFFSAEKFLVLEPSLSQVSYEDNSHSSKFKKWSLFPFIVRDVAVWVPEGVKSEGILKIIKDNAGEMVVRGPELFDEFKKGDKNSYAFRLVFQSLEKTLTDAEINEIMTKITNEIKNKETNGTSWQVR